MSKTYIIAKGKALTSKKGVVSSGDHVEVKHFASQSVFDDLVKKGYIVEVAQEKADTDSEESKSAKKSSKKAEETKAIAEESKAPTFTLED